MSVHEEWQEFDWKTAPRMPPGRHKKLKLYVDINIPEPLVAELRAAGLVLHLARDIDRPSRPDERIYEEARHRGLVLLTMDRGFWQDNKHPLKTTAGVIFVDVSPDGPEKATDGL